MVNVPVLLTDVDTQSGPISYDGPGVTYTHVSRAGFRDCVPGVGASASCRGCREQDRSRLCSHEYCISLGKRNINQIKRQKYFKWGGGNVSGKIRGWNNNSWGWEICQKWL